MEGFVSPNKDSDLYSERRSHLEALMIEKKTMMCFIIHSAVLRLYRKELGKNTAESNQKMFVI